MTNVQTRNVKLRARARRILQTESGLDEEHADEVLANAGNNLPVALVMSKTGRSAAEAKQALEQSKGVVAKAIHLLLSS